MDTGYDDWEPPSEATVKLLQARRERSDKIAKLMGDYLLKGYKMLGITCPQCDTILMQTKQGTNYCIACSELDSDADKDDPADYQKSHRGPLPLPPSPFPALNHATQSGTPKHPQVTDDTTKDYITKEDYKCIIDMLVALQDSHKQHVEEHNKCFRRLFEIIERQRSEIKDLKKCIQGLSKDAVTADAPPLPEGVSFPLMSDEAVIHLEGVLADQAMENTVLHELRVVGGSTVKEATTNMLRYLCGPAVAEKYCWKGSTEGRKCFSSLRLKDILFKAVRKNPKTREATNAEIKKVAQEWFRTALDRNGGRRRKQRPAQGDVYQETETGPVFVIQNLD